MGRKAGMAPVSFVGSSATGELRLTGRMPGAFTAGVLFVAARHFGVWASCPGALDASHMNATHNPPLISRFIAHPPWLKSVAILTYCMGPFGQPCGAGGLHCYHRQIVRA